MKSVRAMIADAMFGPALREAAALAQHRSNARHGDPSFAGESAAIAEQLANLGLERGYAVDIAASDGVTQSCTLTLFRDRKWRGLAVEFDPAKFARLAYAYADFDVGLAKCRVSPLNVAALLEAHEAPRDFDLLNLDIDSYDLFVLKSMLERGFRPKLISMEINEKLPPPLYFTVLFDEAHAWSGDHFFGCSAVAAAEVVKPFGYVLADIRFNNAFFVEQTLARTRGIEDREVAAAFASGYVNQPERTRLFPWNHDVDAALAMSPEAALDFFRAFFVRYEGKFDLHIAERAP